ncbi:PREDICTED: Fanconi anemia group J protein-like [Priapulus caudatus]|uniref:Fanconi anemia group J protein-like n=1 Tax=Priapulus caudatus TaxID=37621 RepID=A0ABM1EZ22_PRICU|nr:PREDICTED: Fanconi anemia group J protein-like [Priapulus caudatus]
MEIRRQIIRGIVSSRNCLLESPTGSGKSLALLCSTLAWQAEEQDKQKREMEISCGAEMESCCGADSKSVNNQTDFRGAQGTTADNGDGGATCESKINGSHDAANPPSVKDEKKEDTVIDLTSDGEGGEGEDDDFKPCSKSLRSSLAADQKANGSATSRTWTVEKADTQDDSQAYAIDYEMKLNAMKDQETRASNPKRVAKIFFGTRTHKQVAQIVRELGRTAYGRRARMCILASREFACVHPRVSKQPNKNDACSDLRDPKTVGSCGYFHNAHRLKTQSQLQCHTGFDAQWDIEDLVRLGKKIKVCAYYATRGLKDEADIIFCPYNYLIDPVIRQSMAD